MRDGSHIFEALIATQLAWELTGKAGCLDKHHEVREWAYRYFPDPEHGEWFGHLHCDGSLSTRVKGTLFKGAFHLPRMQLVCTQIWTASRQEPAAWPATQTGPDFSIAPGRRAKSLKNNRLQE